MIWAGIVAVGPSIGLAQKAEQSKTAEDPNAKPNLQAGTLAEKNQQGAARERECAQKDEATYNDCLVQLRTARATERQADYATYSAYISAGALFFAAVAALAAIAAAIYAARGASAAHAGAEQTALAAQAAVRSADIAERSAAETARFAATSAAASAKSADVAERALRGLERPYLFIEEIDTTGLTTEPKPTIRFTIANYGKMPAILRSLSLRLKPNPEVPLRLPKIDDKTYYSVVGPGERLKHRSGDVWGTIEVESSEGLQIFAGIYMAQLFFYGSFHYEDPTGAYHMDRFCLRGNKDGKSWALDGGAEGNRRETIYPQHKRNETDT